MLNSSVTSQSPSTSDVYVTGSNVVVTGGDFKAKGQYRCTFDVTKSAGTGGIVISVRTGTAGTTSDTAQITFTFPAGHQRGGCRHVRSDRQLAHRGQWFLCRDIGGVQGAEEHCHCCGTVERYQCRQNDCGHGVGRIQFHHPYQHGHKLQRRHRVCRNDNDRAGNTNAMRDDPDASI